MNPAEIVKKVLELDCTRLELEEAVNRLKSPGLTEAEQKEALDAAVKLAACSALGPVDVLARIASTGCIDSHDLHALSQRGIATRVWPGTTQRMAQAATTPQAHATGAGVEFGAECEIRPSVHWCFCLKPCVEGGEEKRGRANHSAPYPADLYPGCPCAKCDMATQGGSTQTKWGSMPTRMALCPTCGSKRCPGSSDHTTHAKPERPREGE